MSMMRPRTMDMSGGSPLVCSDSGACSKALWSNGLDGGRGSYYLAQALATLPRGHKQLTKSRSNSLVDSTGTEPNRRVVVITKQDNEPYGFEIQTYKLQHAYGTDMRTYVYKVHEDSPSSHAGLKTGDMLTNINGVNMEGFSHQQTVELIRSSGNFLRIETEYSAKIRKAELQAKLLILKEDFRSKWKDLQGVVRKEQQLLHGTINENKIQEELDSIHSKIFGNPSPGSFLNKHRLTSSSSGKSQLSSMMLNNEDGLGSMSELDEDSGTEACFSRQSSAEEDFMYKLNGLSSMRPSLSQHRSISMTSSESEPMSPNWDSISLSNFFGTLPRKGRKGSIRKNFFKFIPGLHRSVEEEDSQV
ncbi:cytohesin-interacting protein [Bufo bufo]|uniref:cytohesin-interacting protein n=1 Tax=Bufo bufo TaxID=8384 RepID=UPI001ABEA68F|nr:cytohesin-interacting protein [Bufo bufo]XP_040297165.1 cytohesin-interacting protein [Bufo bufo]